MIDLEKKGYHKTNVNTHDELFRTINESEHTDSHRMLKEDFFDFLEWQDMNHMTPTGSEFNSTHALMFLNEKNGSATTVFHKKDHNEAPLTIDSLLPTKRNMKAPFLSPGDWKVKIAIMLN